MLETRRLRARLQRTRELAGELFTEGEQAYAFAQHSPYEHLAARFCAKEAAAKALGLDGFDPLDIEIVGGGAEARLVLHGAAKRRATALGVSVSASLTHLAHIAGAVVLAAPRDGR